MTELDVGWVEATKPNTILICWVSLRCTQPTENLLKTITS